MHQETPEQSSTLASQYALLSQQDKLHLFGKQSFLDFIAECRAQDDLAQALTLSEAALRFHILDAELLMTKADLLLEQHRPDETLEVLALLEQLAADEITLIGLRVRAFHQMGEQELGRVLLAEALKLAPERRMVELLLLDASLRQKAGESDAAYHLYKDVLQREPRNQTALEKIWLASESSRNQRDSLQFHQDLIDQDPYNGMAWFNAGQAHYYLLQYEEAMEAFEYAGMLQPQFTLTFCFAAEVALAIGQPKRALKNLYDILQRTPFDAGVYKLTGQAYLALQNLPKARQYYLMARNLDPMDDEIYGQLGKIYMGEGKPGIAARYFERAVNLDDRNEDYLLDLAEALEGEERHSEAEACYLRATEVAPELTTPWMRHAEFYWKKAQWQGVLDVLDEAEEHTFGADLFYLRAAALFCLERPGEALRAMETALEEEYETHDTFFRYLPDYREHKEIKAILRFFALENA